MNVAVAPETVEAFRRKLEAFAQTLSPREQLILSNVLVATMDPLDRAAAQPISDVLDPEEAALLESLLAEPTDDR